MDELLGILGADERAALALRSLYTAWGYARYRVSNFEDYDLYVHNKEFLLTEGVLTFNDANGRLKALKPDVTLSIARDRPPPPGQVQRLHYHERVFRASRLSEGFEEITQVGLECMGAIGLYETCEVLLLAGRSLAQMGDTYILSISHMGLLGPYLASCPAGQAVADKIADCLARKNPDGMAELAAQYNLPAPWVARALTLEEAWGDPDKALPRLRKAFPEDHYQQVLDELQQVTQTLAGHGLDGRLSLDFSVMNSASYYNGIVFHGYVPGIEARVLSGGRYDPLMRRLGRSDSALGFAVYLDKLAKKPVGGRIAPQPLPFADDQPPGEVLARAEALAARGGVRAVREVPRG